MNSNYIYTVPLFNIKFKAKIIKWSLSLSFVILFISCNEAILPIESQSSPSVTPTTYQISDNLKLYPAVEYIDGSLWEVVVFYYVGKGIVKVDSISPVLTGGKSSKIEIPSNFEKMKFSFQLAPKKSQYYFGQANCRRYFQDFILLEKGKNTLIEINDMSSINLSL